MPSINDAYINSLLADACYVDNLTDGLTGTGLKNALQARMTLSLAEFISQNFTVLVPIDTNDFTESGFDAVIWRRNSDNKLFVSIRGTELGNDWLADADLALNGAARAQYVSMVNWWLQHTTAANAQATQIESSISGGFQLAAPAVGTGRLVGASSVIANGHSLGGHLASAFHRLFGANGRVAHTYTFNSAGFLPGSEFLFQQLEGLLSRGMGRYANGAEQTNYFAENGINVTTNQFWFSQVGTRVPVFNEEGTGVPNHLIYKLTDSLALIEAMSRLDSTLSFDRANQILARTGLTANSLERAVDALQRMLLNPAAPALTVSDVGDSPAARVAYHAALRDFSNSPAIVALADKLTLLALSAQTVGGYALAAQSDFGRFVELQQLIPFLISARPGNESLLRNRLQSLHGADYIDWSADTAARAAASPTNFTDSWYADRTQMLSRLLQANEGDHTIVPRRPGDPQSLVFIQRAAGADRTLDLQINVGTAPSAAQNTNYVIFGSDQDEGGTDLSGLNRNDRIYGGRGNDRVFGLGGNDYLEGGQGADVVDGGDGHDQVYGGAGIDELVGGIGDDLLIGGADSDQRLEGGAGRDYLEGGAGFDNYHLTTSDTAVDTIFDADNAGRLFVDGTMIGGFTTIRDGLYQSTGGLYRMAVLGEAGQTRTASLYRVSDNKTIANIVGIQGPTVLGYTLGSAPVPPSPAATYIRGAASDVFRAWYLQGGGLIPAPAAGRAVADGGGANDHIVGSTHSQVEIFGGAGNDVLQDLRLAAPAAEAAQGVTLSGGAGSDFLYGSGGMMYLDGGGDNDFISSARFDSAPAFRIFTRDSGGGLVSPIAEPPSVVADMGSLLSLTPATINQAVGSYNTTLQRWEFYYRPFAAATVAAGRNLVGDGVTVPHSVAVRRLANGAIDWIAPSFYNEPGSLPAVQYSTTWTTNPSDILTAANLTVTRTDGQTATGLVAHVLTNPVAAMALDGSSSSNALAFINAGSGDDIVFGGAGKDIVDGGSGDDRIDGAGGEDFIEGGTGNDFLVGGRFNDVLSGGADHDIIHGGGESDSLYGGAGNDSLAGDFYQATFDDYGIMESYTRLEPSGDDFLDGGDGNDFLDGGEGDDVLHGGAGNDVLVGFTGRDVMRGGAGDDTLISENITGGDLLEGGSGNDTYVFESLVDSPCTNIGVVEGILDNDVVEIAGGGRDTIRTNYFRVDLPDNVEDLQLNGFAVHAGSINGAQYVDWDYDARARYRGNGLDNVIDASNVGQWGTFIDQFLGGVLIDGGAGADTMIGSDTANTFIVDNEGDTVIENYLGNSRDRIVTPFSTTLSANVEEVELTGGQAVSATGNAHHNLLIGSSNSAINVLSGQSGDDTYRIGANDTVVELANAGNDTLEIDGERVDLRGLTFSLDDYANIENLKVYKGREGGITLLGNDGANVLLGSGGLYSGINVLDGRGGNDTLQDFDMSQFYDYYLSDWINLPPNRRDRLLGGAGDDSLLSTGGNDELDGGSGNDVLRSLNGLVTYVFGAGYGADRIRDQLHVEVDYGTVTDLDQLRQDVVRVTDTTDARSLRFTKDGTNVILSIDGRSDTLTIESFFNLADVARTNVDTIDIAGGGTLIRSSILTGLSGGDRTSASDGNDLLIAPPFASVLSAGEGNDDVIGSGENDTLYGDAGNDYLSGGNGNDTLSGGLGDDRISGGAGNDALNGGAGNDLMAGGAGDDVYFVDNTSDLISEMVDGQDPYSRDTVRASITWECQ